MELPSDRRRDERPSRNHFPLLQRIWQDLVEEYGYGASYESVKRFVRTLAPQRRGAVGVFHCAPGAEAQVDFFRGAPTLDVATGEWRRPWVFRMTLGHSRHGYEEAVWNQKLETFLGLHRTRSATSVVSRW